MSEFRSYITRWNCAALIVVFIGAFGTISTDQWLMHRWVESGEHYPVGERSNIELDAGTHVVYYESSVSVPVLGHAMFHALDQDQQSISIHTPIEIESYRVPWTGVSGRSMWTFELLGPARLDFVCYNTSYPSNQAVPKTDRIVFQKKPVSLSEAQAGGWRVRIIGMLVTLVMVAGLYIQHLRVIATTARAQAGD